MPRGRRTPTLDGIFEHTGGDAIVPGATPVRLTKERPQVPGWYLAAKAPGRVMVYLMRLYATEIELIASGQAFAGWWFSAIQPAPVFEGNEEAVTDA